MKQQRIGHVEREHGQPAVETGVGAEPSTACETFLPPLSGAPVNAAERHLSRWLLRFTDREPIGVRLWNGERIAEHDDIRTWLVIRDRGAFYRLLTNPDYEFGELFSQGRLSIEGTLVEFLDRLYRAGQRNPQRLPRLGLQSSRRARNSLEGSRRNIHHHYDIGNDFYRLWLDAPYMQYTCAYYPDPSMSLEQAQQAKMEHVCRKLRLQPGDRVIEAGCGWGGFARYMASRYGVRVRAFNISAEQIRFAREQAKREGLDAKVEYVEDDYRNIDGECDVFVSVGMLEHVGRENYRGLGAVIDRVLTANGRGLIHSIGRDYPMSINAWISQRIFPGAYPPTLREMQEIFEPNGFSVLDVENLRLHYAQTLRHWLERFEQHADEIRRMYDIDFERAWRLYLAGSIATFRSGGLQLFQVAFARTGMNDLPWSRAHLYE